MTFAILSGFDEGPVIDMPSGFDRSIPKKSTEHVSILKNFLKCCLTLVKNEDALIELSVLIDKPERDL